jgi:hypothetical protein
MAKRKAIRKDLRSAIRQLDDDDLKRVCKIARSLAGDDDGGRSSTSKTPESLVEGQSLPSYTAAADPDAYEAKKELDDHRGLW